MGFEPIKKVEQTLATSTDQVEQLFDDLVALLCSGDGRRLLVSFASEDTLQRTRHQLLRWASDSGWLLYEDPIPGTLDREFYLEEDTDD